MSMARPERQDTWVATIRLSSGHPQRYTRGPQQPLCIEDRMIPLHDLSSIPDLPRLLSGIPPEMHNALRSFFREPEADIVPKPMRRGRAKQYNDEPRGQRLLALMAECGCGYCTAAKQTCIENLEGANLEACEKRMQRWYLAHEQT